MKQPEPISGNLAVFPRARVLFASMLWDRYKVGLETYGTPLMTNNGRDALLDAMEECLDLWVYLVQIYMEREERFMNKTEQPKEQGNG